MGIVWVLVGVGVVAIALGIGLFVIALRHRRGRVFGILGGVVLILAAFILLACYLPVFVVPDAIANSAVFNKPAPVDASATIYYLSPTVEPTGTPGVTAFPLIAVAARTGAIRWQRKLSEEACAYVLADGVLYVANLATGTATGSMVAAYRATDGAMLWQTTMLPGPLLCGGDVSLAASGNTLYVPIQGGITAMRASDGALLWSTSVTVVGKVTATPDAIYVSSPTSVQAYRASDGKPLWARTQLSAPPVVGAARMYLPLYQGGFAAVRADDGSVICHVSGFIASSIAFDDGTVYLAGAVSFPAPSDTVYAYDATTCTPRWHARVAPRIDGLVAAGGAVYVNADDGSRIQGSDQALTALRAADGKTLWYRGPVGRVPPGTGWQFAMQPIVLGSTLFVTSVVPLGGLQLLVASDYRMHLYALNGADGSEYWNTPISRAISY